MLKNTSQNREKSTQNRTCNVQRATLHVQSERCNAKTRPIRLQGAHPQFPYCSKIAFLSENVAPRVESGSTLGPKIYPNSYF